MLYSFYEDLEELRKEDPDANMGFMGNIDLCNGLTAYDFLHGECCQFAMALSVELRLPIKVLRHSTGKLIHAFCCLGNIFVDARGFTSDAEAFFGEYGFEATLYNGKLYDEDGECYIEHFPNADAFCEDIEEYIDTKTYSAAKMLMTGAFV